MWKFSIKTLLVCCLLSVSQLKSNPVFAQQDEQMSMYMFNPLYFNPAYAGSREALSAVGLARLQWSKFDGSPRTQWLSVHAPLMFKALGAGVHLVNDKIGDRDRTSVYADFSSGIKLNKNDSRLAVGISAGFDMMTFDFTSSQVIDQNDPYFGSQINVNKPNVGAGIYYYNDNYFVGLSSPRILEVKVNDANEVIESLNKRHYFLSAGYVFHLNSVFKLKPSMLTKYTPNAPLTVDANLSLLMYDRIWTGLMYRYHESMGVNVIIKIKEAFSFGYVYDFPINGLRTYQSGSHEIMLQYDFNFKDKNFTSPRYF